MSQWLERYRRVHPSVVMRDHDPKFGLVFSHGSGSQLWDTDGRDYIDLTCGYAACNFGQAFAPLVAAAQRQLTELTQVTGEPHRGRIELAEQLLDMFAPSGGGWQVVFNTTGARGVETAWKAAVAYRPGRVVALGPAFHGRSIATTALGHSPPATPLPLQQLGAAVEVRALDEYPYCAACRLAVEYPQCNMQCMDSLLASLAAGAPEISAVIVEPAIGARGYIFPPAEFFVRLRQVTAEHGILLIADEIQTGLGRCGHLSLAQAQGWQPDVLVLGKSLAGGIAPLSAVLGRSEVLTALPPGSESETYAASPLATAVALEVLQQLRSGPWLQRGQQLGATFREWARRQLAQSGWQGCRVEGQGASCVVEFRGLANSPGANSPGAARCRQFVQACRQHGVLTHLSGPELTRCVWLPALTMSDSERELATVRLGRAFAAIATNSPIVNREEQVR